ncbi:MAG: hypothetical protein ABIP88_05030 [Candidatus Binatia bacterium]
MPAIKKAGELVEHLNVTINLGGEIKRKAKVKIEKVKFETQKRRRELAVSGEAILYAKPIFAFLILP